MRDYAAEQRVGACGSLIGVGVEGIAGELGEVRDVRERDRPRASHHAVPDPQLGQRLAERVLAFAAGCPR